ncbi:Hypothetical predicted protein [Pelobates cultripes]|uniref:Uncharacterized protein n=1 Tax=Pelobates cultripes TaxID=61616 RepID=A0AAD1RDB0_PELCU|nr:Hypothetical predicted protein [Pelobates cultripes]
MLVFRWCVTPAPGLIWSLHQCATGLVTDQSLNDIIEVIGSLHSEDWEWCDGSILVSYAPPWYELQLPPPVQAIRSKKELPLEFKTDITTNWGKWHGSALIPWSYFPPGVDMMNSYAIHGSGIGRVYEALYPIPPHEIGEGQGPNFHRLEYFKEFSLQWIMGADWEQPSSNLWESDP